MKRKILVEQEVEISLAVCQRMEYIFGEEFFKGE